MCVALILLDFSSCGSDERSSLIFKRITPRLVWVSAPCQGRRPPSRQVGAFSLRIFILEIARLICQCLNFLFMPVTQRFYAARFAESRITAFPHREMWFLGLGYCRSLDLSTALWFKTPPWYEGSAQLGPSLYEPSDACFWPRRLLGKFPITSGFAVLSRKRNPTPLTKTSYRPGWPS